MFVIMIVCYFVIWCFNSVAVMFIYLCFIVSLFAEFVCSYCLCVWHVCLFVLVVGLISLFVLLFCWF